MGEELTSRLDDGLHPADAERPRRRIVTRLHSGDESDGSPDTDCAMSPVRTSWAARAWVDGSFVESTGHPNRYVAPAGPEATPVSGQNSPLQVGSTAHLWNKLAKAIRGAWTRLDRERSGCSEQHGD